MGSLADGVADGDADGDADGGADGGAIGTDVVGSEAGPEGAAPQPKAPARHITAANRSKKGAWVKGCTPTA